MHKMLLETIEGERILEDVVMVVSSAKLYLNWPLNSEMKFMKQKMELYLEL